MARDEHGEGSWRLVDDEQLRRPSHWDMRLIRRFMTFFGPISSAPPAGAPHETDRLRL